MDLVDSFLPALTALGSGGYFVVFLISFAEALPVVGLILPGSILVGLFGFFSAQGYLSILNLVWFAAVGAILGDGIGYYLGTKGMRFFRNENRILKLSHLEQGEKFFRKHGDKSILLGRFIGILRPIVPFVAGLSGMDIKAFFFWNVIGGVLWAMAYLLLGYFFGSALPVIEIWSAGAGIFLASLLVLTIVIRAVLRHKKK